MQRLLGELENVPTDASQVCSTINSQLNKGRTLYPIKKVEPSVEDGLKDDELTNNDAEVNQQGHIPDQSLRVSGVTYVFVLNRKGHKPSIKREKSKMNPGDIYWVGKKRYVCKGVFNKGNTILYGDVKKKDYSKFKDVSKIYRFGSLVWN